MKIGENIIKQWEDEQERLLLWEGIALQQITIRSFSQQLLAMDLVEVAPMPEPQGNIHFLDYVYDSQEDVQDTSGDGE